MPWPQFVLDAFTSVPGGVENATDESLLYGPWKVLLNHLFPGKEGYIVSPQRKRPLEGWSIDHTVLLRPTKPARRVLRGN